MSEKPVKKKRPRGFAGVLAKQFDPLNNIEHFRQKFKKTQVKLLLNAVDGRYAALIIIDNGVISIEGVPNKDKKDLKKKVLGWKGKLEAKTEMFLNFAMGKVAMGALAKKMFTGKLRGPRKLLILVKLFKILEHEQKKSEAAALNMQEKS